MDGQWFPKQPIQFEGDGFPLKAFEFSYTDFAVSSTDTSTYTFTNRNIGAADAGRAIIVGVSGTKVSPASSVSNVSVGGVNLSVTPAVGTGSANTQRFEFWSGIIPTGTTASVVVSWPNNQSRCTIIVARMVGYLSLSPYDWFFDAGPTDPLSGNLDVAGGGGVLGVSLCSVSPTSCSWSLSNEVYDGAIETGRSGSMAYEIFSTAQNNLAVSADWSSASAEEALIAASWR